MTPNRVAIVHENRTLTYGEVSARVRRVANALRGVGVGRGDRVGYLGQNHPALGETLFASGLLGAIFVPLNTRLAPPELEAQIIDAEPRVLFWAPAFAETAAALRDRVHVRDYVAVDCAADHAAAR